MTALGDAGQAGPSFDDARIGLLSRLPGDVLLLTDAEGRYLYASPSVTRTFGYTQEEFLAASGTFDLVHPDDVEMLTERFFELRSSPFAEQRFEVRLRLADGSYHWVEVLATNLLDDPGVAALAIDFRDVHDRHEAEEALRRREEQLRQREAQLRTILNHSRDLLTVVGLDGTIRWVSDTSVDMLGRPPEDLIGRSAFEIIHPGDVQSAAESFARVVAGEELGALVLRAVRADGSVFDIEGLGEVLSDADGNPEAVVVNVRDVSSRLDAERALQQSEARFRALLQYAGDVVVVVGPDATFTYASPPIASIFGWDPEDLVGKPIVEFVHPDDLADLLEGFQELLVHPERVVRREFRALHPSGEFRPVEAVGSNQVDNPAVGGIVTNLRDLTWRQEAEEAVRRSEARFRALVQNSTDAVVVIKPDGTFGYVSPQARYLFGWPDEDDVPQATLDLLNEKDVHEVLGAVERLLARPDEPVVREFVARNRDGEDRIVEVVATNQLDNDVVGGIVANIRDITERREAERARRTSDVRFATVMQHTFDVTALVDRDGVIKWVTPNSVRLLGWQPDEVVGRAGLDLVHPDDRDWLASELVAFVSGEGVPNPTPIRMLHRDGGWRDVEIVGTSFLDNPDVDAIAVHLRDVGERVAAERRLEHAATHDPLTELPNRTLLLDRLEVALARSRRSHSQLAVLFCDLDHFKVVNDSLGHSQGDAVLRAVAERFSAPLRPGDTVSRFGGDEFVILCEDLESPADAHEIADRIIGSLDRAVRVDGHEVFVGVSIGIALAHDGSADPESLIRDADAAMYRAKARGRGRHQLFEPDMWEEALGRFDLENALRRALERDELEVHYQPVLSLRHDPPRVEGVEALVRWNHPERGVVMPNEFIALAEEIGLVGPIGEWVLREACAQLRRWDAEAGGDCGITMSVNISGRQLDEPGLADKVAAALAACGLEPDRLTLEITESMLMRDVTLSEDVLGQIRRLGVRLAVDDFGTGYSSMSYLRRFPVDALKVDRSFVDGLGSEPEDSAIVAAIVNLAHTLGLAAVGEGVETDAQLRALRDLGCDQAQGFLLHHPLPAAGVGELLGAAPRV